MLTDLKATPFPKIVGVYNRSQNWRTDEPSRFVSIPEARAMRKSGQYYSINSGKDIAEAGERAQAAPEEQKSRWQPIPSGTMAIGFVNVLQLV